MIAEAAVKIPVQFYHLTVDRAHENATTPEWAGLVERWYQLDTAAYALASAYWQLRERLARPELIILASPGASNATDFDFAHGGATSAAKFVHTLPNVRGTSLFQVLRWAGPTLCLQNGEQTLLSALAEAADEFSFAPREIWLFSVKESDVYLFRLSAEITTGPLLYRRRAFDPIKTAENGVETVQKIDQRNDSDLTAWLSRPNPLAFTWQDSEFWERELESTSL